MASRLDDLISTGEKQLASRSYDAAIDTFRTALGEPGAVELDVAGRLDAACRARDAARGVVPLPAEPPAPPPKVELAPLPVEAPAERLVEPTPEPEAVDDRTIEAPAFHLIEDDPYMLERARRGQHVEAERLSILDPTPLPEEPDRMQIARIVVAALIAFVVCGAVFLASYRKSHQDRFAPGQSFIAPVVQSKTEPEYTEEARQAKIEGTVVLDVEIEPDGTVTVLRVVKGLEPGLDARAIEAVGKWRFWPARLNGDPVKAEANLEVNFRLL
jgi:TonB family protein